MQNQALATHSACPVLWADDALLIVNKPAGLRSVADGYDPALPHIKTVLESEWGPLWMVHRLDRETSGALVVARSAQAHRVLNQQFDDHVVQKVYHAIIVGDPPWDEQAIDLPLRPNGDRRHRTVIDRENGKPAQTLVRVIKRSGNLSVVEAHPRTGRTHQIRAHFAAVGFPIAGDELYLRDKGDHPVPRLALHAWSIAFHHPASLERFSIEAPYPVDFDTSVLR